MSNNEFTNSDAKLQKIGLLATFIYVAVLTLVLIYAYRFGWLIVGPLELNQVGDLLAGLFGPLAIFWLILGFLQQGDELRNSVAALRLQAEELKSSVEQQKNLVKVTERQLALDEEARRVEAHLLVQRELPFFLLEPSGSASSGGSCVSKFKLKNRGGDAREVSINVQDPTLTASPSFLQVLDAGGEAIISIKGARLVLESRTQTPIIVNGFSNDDNVRNQTFNVGGNIIELIDRQTIIVAKGVA